MVILFIVYHCVSLWGTAALFLCFWEIRATARACVILSLSCEAEYLYYSCSQLPFREGSLATKNCWILATSEVEREPSPGTCVGAFFPYLLLFSCVTLPLLYGSFLVPSIKGHMHGFSPLANAYGNKEVAGISKPSVFRSLKLCGWTS